MKRRRAFALHARDAGGEPYGAQSRAQASSIADEAAGSGKGKRTVKNDKCHNSRLTPSLRGFKIPSQGRMGKTPHWLNPISFRSLPVAFVRYHYQVRNGERGESAISPRRHACAGGFSQFR